MPLKICKYQTTTMAAIGKFLAEEYPAKPLKGDGRFLNWRTRAHPLGDASERSWVALDGETVVGHVGCLPDVLVRSGREISVSWMIDLRVSNRIKTRVGLGVQLLQAAMRDHPVLLVFGICPEMRDVYRMMGWRNAMPVETFVSVLRPLGTMALTHPERFSPLTRGAAARVSSAVDDAAAWIQTLLPSGRRSVASVSIEPVSTFGPEIDDFLGSLPPCERVSNGRSAELLEWKFVANPFTAFSAWIARDRNNRQVRGYLVAKRFQRGGGRWMEIADLVAHPDSPNAIAELIAEVRKQAHLDGMDFLRVRTSDASVLRALKRPAWFRFHRPFIDEIAVYASEPASLDELANPAWSLTSIASDAVDYGGDEWGQGRLSDEAGLPASALAAGGWNRTRS